MKSLLGVISAFALVALFVGAVHVADAIMQNESRRMAGATVKLTMGEAHCSGAHIGGGIILTAWHCTEFGPAKIKTDLGAVADTELMWGNRLYDVALLSTPEPPNMLTADVDCLPSYKGQTIYAIGSPLDLEFIRTQGTIVSRLITGEAIVDGQPIWKERLVANITTAPGSSGGPVFNSLSKIVGIVVGMYGAQPDFAALVPAAPTLCRLLGKAGA